MASMEIQKANCSAAEGSSGTSHHDGQSVGIYKTTKASGQSFFVQGNVIGDVHCHLGCAYRSDYPDLTKSKTISFPTEAAQRGTHEPVPPRAHSIDYSDLQQLNPSYQQRRDGIYPEHRPSGQERRRASASDPVRTLTMVGLDENDYQAGRWRNCKTLYETKATNVRLTISDGSEHYKQDHRSWKTCVLSIEAQDRPSEEIPLRRLKITACGSSVLWLPHARVRVVKKDDVVSIWFSNCNRLYSYRKNGRPQALATYNPEKPNVHIKLVLPNKKEAANFSKHVLCEPMDDAQGLHEFDHCRFMHHKHTVNGETQEHGISAWKREAVVREEVQEYDQRQYIQYRVYEMFAFSFRLDFAFSICGQHIKLCFGHMNQLKYYPDEDHPRLPQEVKRTPDGGPASIEMAGGASQGSTVTLTANAEEIQELLNSLIQRILTWRFEAIFFPIEAKISKSSFFKTPGRSKKFSAQVTIWSHGDQRRILMRDDTEYLWFSITLRKGEQKPVALSKTKDKEVVLTIEKIICEDGVCLSTSELRPFRDGSSSKTNIKDNLSEVELKFRDTGMWDRFSEVVTKHYLSVT